jgi:hypothetical protein
MSAASGSYEKIIEPSLDASYILTRMAAFKTKEDTPFNLFTAAKV